MKIKLENADGVLQDISTEVAQINQITDVSKQKSVLSKIGAAVQKRVQQAINVSRRTPEGSYREEHEHIRNDVVYAVKKSRKAGGYYVTVSGGRNTWRLWHLVNDGHVQNGHYTPGNKFVDKAVIMSEQEVMQIFDEAIGATIK